MSFLAAAGWTVLLSLGVETAISVTESVRPGAVGDLVNVTACHLLVHLAAVLMLVRIYAAERPLRETLAVRRTAPATYVLAPLAGAALYPALARLDDLAAARFPQDPRDAEVIEQLTRADTVAQRVVLVAALVVVMPLGEELFFRGVLYGRLRQERPVLTALLATSGFFALSRLEPRTLGSTAALGLLTTGLRAQTGSTIPALLAHGAFFLVPLAPLAWGRPVLEDDAFSPTVVAVTLAAAGLCLAGTMLAARSHPAARLARGADDPVTEIV
jgi:membrane protease YdiL (CAAX protease family)